jgi:hypothetical protein
MRKILSSAWMLSLISAGAVGVACTVETKDKDDGHGGSAGEDSRGGSSATGGSSAKSTGGSRATGGGDGSPGGADNTGAGEGNLGGRGGADGIGSGGLGEAGTGGNGPTTSLLDCASRSATNATIVERVVNGDTTWSGTVYLEDNVQIVDGATLTIAPGTNVIMGPDASVDIGWNGSTATLKAAGTEAQPIRFCGEQGDAGFWRGIIVERNVTSNSQLHHVLISDAGASPEALNLAADIDVQTVQVRNAQRDGVRAQDFRAGSREISVEGVGGTPIIFTHANAIENFPMGGRFEHNGKNVAALDFTFIDSNVRFRDLGIPYQQEGELQIQVADVVIDPAVHYLLGPDASIQVGWNGNAATFTAAGTSDGPIVFDGTSSEPGFWKGINVVRKVTSNSKLSNVEIRHAGGNGVYALEVSAPITLDGVLLSDNDAGAHIAAQGLDKASKNLTITKGEQRPLTVEPDALVSLPEGGAFTGNEVDEIGIEGGSYQTTGTVPNLGVPFRVLDSITTLVSSLTLSAGSEFIMTADSSLEIGWNGNAATLIAVGTAAKPIRFVGAEATAGYWAGLLLDRNVRTDSKLDYVEISHGKDACLTLASSVAVTHSKFAACSGYGILRNAADSRDYETGNTFTDVASGHVGDL